MRKKMGLMWHHHEDLGLMVLVDARIHNPAVKHFGSSRIIQILSTPTFQKIWRVIYHYEAP